jgi:replicative DNA helicase
MFAEDIAVVSLEMTASEMLSRVIANRSKLDVGKVIQHKLTSAEKSLAKKKYLRMVNTLKESGTRFTVYSPEEDVGIQEVLFLLKPYGYKVIVIDYISLLKDSDTDENWRALGKVARFAKRFASANNIIVVLLCQVGEEGRVRYSGAITEHASNAWLWTCDEKARESGIITVEQPKARNQNPFSFHIRVDFSTMSIYDVDESEVSSDSSSGTEPEPADDTHDMEELV